MPILPSTAYVYSGVRILRECHEAFDGLAKREYRFITYTVTTDNNTEVRVEKKAPATATHQDFLDALPGDDCRYVVLYYEYDDSDGHPCSKIVFISWCPEAAPPMVGH